MQTRRVKRKQTTSIRTNLQVSYFLPTSFHSNQGFNCALHGLGSCSLQTSNPFYALHFRRVRQHLRLQKSPPLPPWVSAYLGRFPNSHRHHTCSPPVSSSLTPERRHFGDSRDQWWAGTQNSRGGKWCGLTPLALIPGPPRPSQKPRPPSWL